MSRDFAVSVVPGWHTPIFTPWQVAGAIAAAAVLVPFLPAILVVLWRSRSRP